MKRTESGFSRGRLESHRRPEQSADRSAIVCRFGIGQKLTVGWRIDVWFLDAAWVAVGLARYGAF